MWLLFTSFIECRQVSRQDGDHLTVKLKPKAQFEELILGTSQDMIGLKSQASCFDGWPPDTFFWEKKAVGASGAARFEWTNQEVYLLKLCVPSSS